MKNPERSASAIFDQILLGAHRRLGRLGSMSRCGFPWRRPMSWHTMILAPESSQYSSHLLVLTHTVSPSCKTFISGSHIRVLVWGNKYPLLEVRSLFLFFFNLEKSTSKPINANTSHQYIWRATRIYNTKYESPQFDPLATVSTIWYSHHERFYIYIENIKTYICFDHSCILVRSHSKASCVLMIPCYMLRLTFSDRSWPRYI